MLEWRTLVLTGACYGLWVACGMMWQTSFWWLAIVPMAFVSAFHTSLQHETIHGHPTPWQWFNELLVSLPLAVVFPYRRYKDLHLKHHNDINLTDPYEDPESYFWPVNQYQTMRPFMRQLFVINNTLIGRLTIGPVLTTIGFARTEIRRLIAGEKGVRMAWLLHGVGLAVLYVIITQIFAIPAWAYLLGVAYPAMSLTSLRSYAEHQAAENVGARSAIVETCPLFALLFLNNNLHIVHHASPGMAWYDLPALYRERRQQFLAANENTLFDGYSEILRRFAFRVKQPVDHPLGYRDEARTE